MSRASTTAAADQTRAEQAQIAEKVFELSQKLKEK